MTIDYDGPTPLYLQLAAILRGQIRSGELPANWPIPSERRLMQIYELGRDTVRHAVQVLREEGLLVAQQGRGMFVVEQAGRDR